MTSRNYDVILTVSNAAPFKASNSVVGNTTSSVGYIAGIDLATNTLRVKLANSLQEFSSTEQIHSNAITVTGTANGRLNSTSLPFQANVMSGNVTTAIATISAIAPSTFIAEKNAFTQNPIVRLYSIYYPGEWYPPNQNGNPTGQGEGRAWPTNFPIRFAEIVGDLAQDIKYNVSYAGVNYVPFPVNLSGLEQGSDGKINELSISVFNVDNQISRLVEDPFLAGNNISNSVLAIVNGEYVHGIDPRTVNSLLSDFNVDTEQYKSLLRARQQGLNYDQYYVDSVYGMANATFTRDQTLSIGGTWQAQKMDTRDMLGGIVEIKTTFANFLDYWPEYSLVYPTNPPTANSIAINNALPYRMNDTVRLSSNTYNTARIISIDNNETLYLDKPITKYLPLATRDGSMQGLAFKPDGTKMYLLGDTVDRVYEYNLPNTWDISTASYVQQLNISGQDTVASGLALSSNGSYLYLVGQSKDNVYRYTMSTPWNVITATQTQAFNIAPYDTTSTGLAFDSSGSNLYLIGYTADKVFQFNLAVAWDLATASYMQNVSVGTQDSVPTDIVFNNDGSTLYLVGSTKDRVHQYNLSESWNVATVSYSSNVYVGYYDSTPSTIAFNDSGNRFYVAGTTNDNLHQIPLTTAWDITTSNCAIAANEPVYIVNPQADGESFLEDKYKIDQLEGLTEQVATFGLISWLQYFKVVTPKRKYYKNTCQWQYKGPECQYPGPSSVAGANSIPGTNKTAPPYAIAANNVILPSTEGDVCAKSLAACMLRNNSLHFGGFPGVGRTVPRV